MAAAKPFILSKNVKKFFVDVIESHVHKKGHGCMAVVFYPLRSFNVSV